MARTGRVPLEASRSSARGTARGPQRLDRSARSWMFEVACALALVLRLTRALRLAWLCDDAYISFRYADNLVHGLGLVFNAGERVEGYSNFLWTLWCAVGIGLGYPAESWANVSGLLCFAVTIALLGWITFTVRDPSRGPLFPLAALAYGVHREACIFATGGLET